MCICLFKKLRESPAKRADFLLAVAAKAEQGQQAGEQIEHLDKQADRGQHVVALAAVHNLAGLKQDQTG
jgi:hypothetical protein